MNMHPSVKVEGERRGEGIADVDVDAVLAGTFFGSLAPVRQAALLSVDLGIDVDSLVAAGFAGAFAHDRAALAA